MIELFYIISILMITLINPDNSHVNINIHSYDNSDNSCVKGSGVDIT